MKNFYFRNEGGNDPYRQLYIHREKNMDSRVVYKKTWNRVTASHVIAHEKLV